MLRMTAFASLALALCCLVASLIFVLPPLLAARPTDLPGTPRLLQFLPLAAAGLGLLGGVISLFAIPAPADPHQASALPGETWRDIAEREGAESALAPSVAGLEAAIQQLYTLLTEERAEVGALREVCSKGTQEAMTLSERFATVAEDLETRIAAGIAQVETALRNPAGAATRAAEATLRVERALARTETALRALPEASSVASNAAASLRQEAAGLIAAAQQVSVAQKEGAPQSAPVPADISPQHVAEMTDIASRLTTTLESAVETLSDGRQALDTAGQHVVSAGEKAAVRLTEVAEATLKQLAAAAKEAPAARVLSAADLPQPADLSELTTITARLQSTAETLSDGTRALNDAGTRVAASGEAAVLTLSNLAAQSLAKFAEPPTSPDLPRLASITASLQTTADRLAEGTKDITETGQTQAEKLAALVEQSLSRLSAAAESVAQRPPAAVSTQVEPDLSGLTHLAEDLKSTAATLAGQVGALDQTGRAIAATGQSAAAQLAAATQDLVTAGQAAVEGISVAGEAVVQRIDGAEFALRRQAAALTAAPADITRAGTEAAQLINQAAARILAAADNVREQASALETSGGTIRHAGDGAAAAIVDTARNAMGELRQGIALLQQHGQRASEMSAASAPPAGDPSRPEWEMPDLAGLTALTQTLSAAAATLVDGMSALDAAAQRVATTGEAVADRLASAQVPPPDPALAMLPELSAAIAAASAGLQQDAAVLTDAARNIAWQLAAPAPDNPAMEILAGAAMRADATAAGIEQSGRVIAQAADTVSAQIGRLASIAAHAETQAAVLPGLTAQLSDTTSRLQAVAAHEASSTPPFDALGARIEGAIGPALQNLSHLSAQINAAVARMESTLSHHDGTGQAIAALMTQVQARLASVVEAVQERAPTAATPVAATLQHLRAVSRETELLLQQTEALAESVVAGQAPELPGQLANRAPALLAELEATIRRLQSVATAVALASDGPPPAERRAG